MRSAEPRSGSEPRNRQERQPKQSGSSPEIAPHCTLHGYSFGGKRGQARQLRGISAISLSYGRLKLLLGHGFSTHLSLCCCLECSEPTAENASEAAERHSLKSLIVTLSLITFLIPAPSATAALRRHSHDIVIDSPSGSPALAQSGAEALFLHPLGDGRTMLYVEDRGGRSLTILDVTTPGDIRLAGHASLASRGPFDFVNDLTDHATLIRYRSADATVAFIDFRHWMHPSMVDRSDLAGAIGAQRVGLNGLLLCGNPSPALMREGETYTVVDASALEQPLKLGTISSVTQQLERSDTQTVFLLNPSGITVVRSLSAEQRAFQEENPTN